MSCNRAWNLVWCFLLFTLLFPAWGLGQQYFFQSFNVKNGLAQSQVNALMCDQQGRLWIGTNGGGLQIYDGHSFQTLTLEKGLGSNFIYSILEDQEGKVLTSEGKGLMSHHTGREIKAMVLPPSLEKGRVNAMTQLQDGTIWMGTRGAGMFKLKNGHFRSIPTKMASALVW